MQSNADKLRALGIPVPYSKHSGQIKVRCPRCAADAKHKNKTDLSVDLDSGMWRCHNTPECNYKGWCNKVVIPEKIYAKPTERVNITPLHPDVVAEFSRRAISQQTLIKMKIQDGMEFMFAGKIKNPDGTTTPIEQGPQWTIQFPYYEQGELVNIKYRSAYKQFRMVKDAKLIFYNLDAIIEPDWCIIVEGEIDALTFVEAGYDNVCSIPNGASASENLRMEFLDNCHQYFENKVKIILATDDDAPGRAMRTEIIRRLGAERCYTVEYAEGCKDINEHVLSGAGILSVATLIQNAKACPIRGLRSAADLSESVYDLFSQGRKPGIGIGIIDSDTNEELVYYNPSQLIIVTGIPGAGKSEGTDQDVMQLAIQHGWKFGIFSPENFPLEMYISKLIEKITGKHFGKTATNLPAMTADDIQKAIEFINEHFFFITEEDIESFNIDDILAYGKILVKKYGINGLVIDPWNTLEHSWDRHENETMYINKSLRKIILFNRFTGVSTWVIAHPEKMKKASNMKEYPIPTLYNISGSANWANRADIGMTWYRNYKDGTTTRAVQKVKQKHQGKVGTVKYRYNVLNGRFTEMNSPPDTRNWLVNNSPAVPSPAIDWQAAPTAPGIVTSNEPDKF